MASGGNGRARKARLPCRSPSLFLSATITPQLALFCVGFHGENGVTKKDRILKLNDGVRTLEEIAALVGCLPSYCRVVIRQRKGKSVSDIDLRYRASQKGMKYRAVENAAAKVYARIISATADKTVANAAAKRAYRKTRRAVADVATASKVLARTRLKSLRDTGNRDLASAASKLARRQAREAMKPKAHAET